MNDRAEHWIGAGIAAWFCFFFAGWASVLIAAGLAIPGALYMAGKSEEVASLGKRFRVAWPGAMALTAFLIGVIGILGK